MIHKSSGKWRRGSEVSCSADRKLGTAIKKAYENIDVFVQRRAFFLRALNGSSKYGFLSKSLGPSVWYP